MYSSGLWKEKRSRGTKDWQVGTEGPRLTGILEKTMLHDIYVSGNVLWSPTSTYISQKKRGSGNLVSDFRVSVGPL